MMRCVACGAEMQVVSAVLEQSMLLSGQELRTFDCPHCHRSERSLASTRTIGQLPTERMVLPSSTVWRSDIPEIALAAGRRVWTRVVEAWQNVRRARSVP
jgi:hypothetical protein